VLAGFLIVLTQKTMDINDKKVLLNELAKAKFKEFKLEGWVLYFTNHHSGSLGMCYPYDKKIRLSNIWVDALEMEESEDTLLHEIAHALSSPECSHHNHKGHGDEWYQNCLKVGIKNPQIYHISSAKQKAEYLKRIDTYIGECPECGYRTPQRKRRSNGSCPKCSKGVYNDKYKLVWQTILKQNINLKNNIMESDLLDVKKVGETSTIDEVQANKVDVTITTYDSELTKKVDVTITPYDGDLTNKVNLTVTPYEVITTVNTLPVFDFIIDEQIKNRIPALTAEEYSILEKNILKDDCRDSLVVAKILSETINVLADGHNRYEICKRNNRPFNITELTFANREEVYEWVDNNQLGKRNLSYDQKAIIVGGKYNREKGEQGGDRKSKGKGCTLNTAKKFADENKLSERTVKNYGKIAERFEKLKAENPLLANDIFNGITTFRDIKENQSAKRRKDKPKVPPRNDDKKSEEHSEHLEPPLSSGNTPCQFTGDSSTQALETGANSKETVIESEEKSEGDKPSKPILTEEYVNDKVNKGLPKLIALLEEKRVIEENIKNHSAEGDAALLKGDRSAKLYEIRTHCFELGYLFYFGKEYDDSMSNFDELATL
jgi:predicted SprT family Zn-dependent metalloprotease